MTDTSPKRLRELASRLWVTTTSDDRVAANHILPALAAEKEAAGCSSFCAPGEPCLVSDDGKCLAEKEAQNHTEQHLEMVLAGVPLPAPVLLTDEEINDLATRPSAPGHGVMTFARAIEAAVLKKHGIGVAS